MTILDCPNCGGIHYGSIKCPYLDTPQGSNPTNAVPASEPEAAPLPYCTHTTEEVRKVIKDRTCPICLRSRVAQLEQERDKLKMDIETINAPSFLCGLIYGNKQPFVGGCGKPVLQHESYRCSDCTASFHRECINEHFELDAYVKGLRELNVSGAINDWKESLAKAEAERDSLREALQKISDLGFASDMQSRLFGKALLIARNALNSVPKPSAQAPEPGGGDGR